MKLENSKINLILSGAIITLLLEVALIILTGCYFKLKLSLFNNIVSYYSVLISIVVLLIIFIFINLVTSTAIWVSKWTNNFSKKYSLFIGVGSSILFCGIGTLVFAILSKKHITL